MTEADYRDLMKIVRSEGSDQGVQQHLFQDRTDLKVGYHYSFSVSYAIFVINCSATVSPEGILEEICIPIEQFVSNFDSGALNFGFQCVQCIDEHFLSALKNLIFEQLEDLYPGDLVW